MKKRQVAILDFGSSKLSAIVGEQGVNNTFVVKGKRELAYEGFFEGEFLDLEELEQVIEKIISDLRSDCKEPFTRLYVGIPGEFVTVVLKEKTISYERKKKITQREVNELYDEAYRLKTNRYRNNFVSRRKSQDDRQRDKAAYENSRHERCASYGVGVCLGKEYN